MNILCLKSHHFFTSISHVKIIKTFDRFEWKNCCSKKKNWSILEDWNVYCLHCIKQSSFPLKISLVNVTKSSVSTRFDHIYWRNPLWKFPFLCSVNDTSSFVHNLFLYKKPGLLFTGFQISESPSTGEITA